MAGKGKKEEQKYNFRQVIICKKCEKISEIPGPCVECGEKIFYINLVVQEI